MSLSDLKIKAAKPTERDYKLADEKGLYLLVKTNGGKYWRLKYRIDGKEKLMALGVYPDTSLALARSKRDEARALLANGIDPMGNKHAVKAAQQAASTAPAIAMAAAAPWAMSAAMIRRAASSPPTGKYLGLRFNGTFKCWLKRCNSTKR